LRLRAQPGRRQTEQYGHVEFIKSRLNRIAKSDIDQHPDPRAVHCRICLDPQATVFHFLADAVNGERQNIEDDAIVFIDRADFTKDCENCFWIGIAEAKQIEILSGTKWVFEPCCHEHRTLQHDAFAMLSAGDPKE